MKLLLLAPEKSVHTIKWLKAYLDRGYQICLITFWGHDGGAGRIVHPHLQLHVLPKLLPTKLSYLFTLPFLIWYKLKFVPDTIHAHYVSSYGLMAALIRGSNRLLISAWGSDIENFAKRSWLHKMMIKYVLRSASGIFAPSNYLATVLQEYTAKKVNIVPFGVDTNLFRPFNAKRDESVLHIGIAKHLYPIYGVDLLVSAMSLISGDLPAWRLVVIGDGPEKLNYQRLAAKLGIGQQVCFLGSRPHEEMPSLLNQLDIFVLPSFRESLGVAALEAQACGVPVIAASVGGLREVVVHQVTGLLVPSHNAEDFAQAIKQLALDPKLRHLYGQNAVKHVRQNYEWSVSLFTAGLLRHLI